MMAEWASGPVLVTWRPKWSWSWAWGIPLENKRNISVQPQDHHDVLILTPFYPAALGMRGRTGRIGVADGLSGDALLSTRAALGSVALRRSCEGSASFVDRSQRDIHNRVGILDHVSEALSDKAALDRH